MSHELETQKNLNIRLAQIHKIHKDSLLCAFSKYLWWPHDSSTPVSSQLWIVLSEDMEHSAKELHTRTKHEWHNKSMGEERIVKTSNIPPHNYSFGHFLPMDNVAAKQFHPLLHPQPRHFLLPQCFTYFRCYNKLVSLATWSTKVSDLCLPSRSSSLSISSSKGLISTCKMIQRINFYLPEAVPISYEFKEI